MSGGIQTFEDLAEYVAQQIHSALYDSRSEAQRATFIANATVATARFCLAVTPGANASHAAAVAYETVRQLRDFESPVVILAREMGTDDELREALNKFLTATDGWDETHH